MLFWHNHVACSFEGVGGHVWDRGRPKVAGCAIATGECDREKWDDLERNEDPWTKLTCEKLKILAKSDLGSTRLWKNTHKYWHKQRRAKYFPPRMKIRLTSTTVAPPVSKTGIVTLPRFQGKMKTRTQPFLSKRNHTFARRLFNFKYEEEAPPRRRFRRSGKGARSTMIDGQADFDIDRHFIVAWCCF